MVKKSLLVKANYDPINVKTIIACLILSGSLAFAFFYLLEKKTLESFE
jgi:hypothetical protein